MIYALFHSFLLGLTILGSSLYGGATLSIAIDYFVEKLSMISWLWQRVSLRPVQPPPCWFSWIVLGAWPSFVLAGLIIQFGITGRGIHHDDGRKSKYTIFFIFFHISLMSCRLLNVFNIQL